MFLSPMFRVAESIDVVVPDTSKLPPIFTLPVVVTLPKFTLSVVPTSCPIEISPDDIVTPVPAVKLPDISSAICAELLTKVLDNSVSAVVIRVEKLELGSINEPEISVDICAELLIKVLDNSVSAVVIRVEKLPLSVCKLVMLVSSVVKRVDKEPLKFVKEPLISDDIWALLLIKVLLSSDSTVDNLVEILALGEVNEPLMSDDICAEPLTNPVGNCSLPLMIPVPLVENDSETNPN